MDEIIDERGTPFNRTTCACKNCVACCKRQPGPLIPGDFERIVDYISEKEGISLEEAHDKVTNKLCASPGALVKSLSDGRTMRVGTIVPRYRKGRCVFLDESDRCSIHPVAPFGCAYYDMHMNWPDAHQRSLWAVRAIMNDQSYGAMRNRLPYATNYKPLTY